MVLKWNQNFLLKENYFYSIFYTGGGGGGGGALQESDTAIQEVAAYVGRQNQLVAELQQGLAGLRRTDQQLRELTSRLVDTGAQLQQTESQLALLEDLLDESALQRRMAECRTDARLLEQRKMADLQRLQGGARHEKYLEQAKK